jgi:adenosylcobinamide-GDP ribazoletransferase
MTAQMPTLADLAADVKVALSFSTRLPLSPGSATAGPDLARALWALPIAGAAVGAFGAAAYWLAARLGLPPLVAATLGVAATIAATGCLHEDGLVDVADGFGGGATRERKLEIMRDSRIGAYGVCALALSVLLRAGALASLMEPTRVAYALLAAHIGARAILPAFMWFVPPARRDGLSADTGRPAAASVVVAAVLGAVSVGVGLGPASGLIAVVLVLIAAAVVARLSLRQIDGQTGDVLGALEQVAEILILLVAARI